MRQSVRNYLREIGRKGGRKSRRVLSSADARAMVQLREARRAFRRYYALCFWSADPAMKIERSDIPWIAEQLRKHGNRETWLAAERLTRGGDPRAAH
jgi:hypothetical protein